MGVSTLSGILFLTPLFCLFMLASPMYAGIPFRKKAFWCRGHYNMGSLWLDPFRGSLLCLFVLEFGSMGLDDPRKVSGFSPGNCSGSVFCFCFCIDGMNRYRTYRRSIAAWNYIFSFIVLVVILCQIPHDWDIVSPYVQYISPLRRVRPSPALIREWLRLSIQIFYSTHLGNTQFCLSQWGLGCGHGYPNDCPSYMGMQEAGTVWTEILLCSLTLPPSHPILPNHLSKTFHLCPNMRDNYPSNLPHVPPLLASLALFLALHGFCDTWRIVSRLVIIIIVIVVLLVIIIRCGFAQMTQPRTDVNANIHGEWMSEWMNECVTVCMHHCTYLVSLRPPTTSYRLPQRGDGRSAPHCRE